MGNIISRLLQLLFSVPGMILALSFHEFSHAYSAHLCGDDTAKYQGRLTLNPLGHLDIIGTLCILLFRFGWGKPVPIDPENFKNRKLGTFITSISGPVSNFLLAFLITPFIILIEKVMNPNAYYSIYLALSGKAITGKVGIIPILYFILYFAVIININLGIFNLIPIPPLDGSKVLTLVLPQRTLYKLYRYENYYRIGLFVLLYLLVKFLPIGELSNSVINFFCGIWEGVFSFI